MTRINSVKALLALVGSATAIEPWTLGELGGSGFASKIYDDLDTDVSIARRPEHSARSNVKNQEKQVSSSLKIILTFIKIIPINTHIKIISINTHIKIIFINTFIKMIIVRLCPTGRQLT